MDILEQLRNHVDIISQLSSDINLQDIITHIERAEKLYELGQSENDEQYYTDVIYRTNQAYEGSLKLAYVVLAGISEEKASKKRTYDFEKYLEEKEIFRGRVLSQFVSYRKEWRNKSTHDFRLFFSANEAFLAILNISTYSYLLLSQIIEKLGYNQGVNKEITPKRSNELQNETLLEKLTEAIKSFSVSFKPRHDVLSEEYVKGALMGYLRQFEQSINIEDRIILKLDMSGIIDILASNNEEAVIVELKRPGTKYNHSFEDQVIRYMTTTKIYQSIIYLGVITDSLESISVEVLTKIIDEQPYKIVVIK